MHIVQVTTKRNATTTKFGSAEMAAAAHEKIKAAIASYQPYKNDSQEVVTVAIEGGEMTFKAEELVSVSLVDLVAAEAVIIEAAVWDETIRAKIAARLAPAPTA